MFAVPSAFYAAGLLRRDLYMQHTFLLAGEAVLDSEILTAVMKNITRRQFPRDVPSGGNFSDTWFKKTAGLPGGIGGFPSGHTIAAFSVGAVFADRYSNPAWHRWVAYGLAALVAFSRMPLEAHFASDVVAGGALAYITAHYVVLSAP